MGDLGVFCPNARLNPEGSMSNSSRTLLLSSVCKPFGASQGDGFSTQAIGLHQNCWVQGLFVPENVVPHWGLDVIASNLEIPTTVLQYPTRERFVEELKSHHYDYVGLSFNECTYHKMVPMVELVREHSPRSEIVLGGYGTVLPDEKLTHLSPHICREEAIGFMRRLLGESADKPFVHPIVTVHNKIFSLPILGETGLITAGLGCPNGCDFCLTTHYFHRKHIRYLDTGQAIVDTIHKLRRAKPGLTSFCIYDEDLLLNQRRGREFLDAMKKSDLQVDISCFASMKALSMYEISELAEMGVSAMWVGFEAQRAGYAKMKSKRTYQQLADECRQYGISLILSMIIGFDYQTPEIIREELAELIRLRPAIPQFLIYGPSGGTPLLERMQKDGRLNEDYKDTRLREGFSLMFDHPTISAKDMRALLMECYEAEYQANGPTIYRGMENTLIGYENLSQSENPRLRARAEYMKKMLSFAWGARQVGLVHAPNPAVRAHIEQMYERIERAVGGPSAGVKALGYAALAAAKWTKFRQRHESLMQPPTTVNRYRWSARTGARVARVPALRRAWS